jgi:glutamate-1-semialdehyde aminotransferase
MNTVTVTNQSSITSKSPKRMLTGLRSVRAQGNRVKLDDDRWYTDWQASLRGDLWGYLPCSFHGAMADALARGPASSIAHQDERIVAEMLGGLYPDVEAVRWMMNGSDACSAAVKVARAYTARERIASYGYHGWAPCFASPPTPYDSDDNRRGTLQAEKDTYAGIDWLDQGLWVTGGLNMDKIAAIIVECPPVDGGKEEAAAWLRQLAGLAHTNGALFILDEVVTGFRYAPGGAAEYYGILGLPDLYCFGKTLGQGVPIAALAGKAEIMEELARTRRQNARKWHAFRGTSGPCRC